jgi:type IV secretion system protein VirB10
MASLPEQDSAVEVDIRPSVARATRPLPPWVFGAGLTLLAVSLFMILDGRRRALQAPAVATRQIDLSGGPSAPALYIPPELAQSSPLPPLGAQVPIAPDRPAPAMRAPIVPAQPVPPPSPPVQAYYPSSPPAAQTPQPQRTTNTSPVVVIDNGNSNRSQSSAQQEGEEQQAAAGARTVRDTTRRRAGAFANRSTSVVQGTLIPAVLESALDSTRPGFVRAIVSRDVRGFDGARILIPRGSRLIGEYESDARSGESRALVNWTRLIRPDGATVAIDSPAADPLGRNGVRARVDTHFFERFGGAILQSILDIGVNAAARAVESPTVIALPGSFGGVASQRIQPQQVTPTLTVKRGTSISVFVARDLDFTGVEQGR